jgi:hypothetical protein
VAIPEDRNVIQKEAEKKLKYNVWNTKNVEHEMYEYTGNNWRHRNSKEKF